MVIHKPEEDPTPRPATVLKFPQPKLRPITKRLDDLVGEFKATVRRVKEADTYDEKQKLSDELQTIVYKCRLLMAEQCVEAKMLAATQPKTKNRKESASGAAPY